jgi:transcriptional regulator with XRE-family HTH domain
MNNSKDKDIGKFVKILRERNELTQEFVSEKIGISRPTLNKIESNKTDLSLKQAKKLADLFNISIEDLLNCREIESILLKHNKSDKEKDSIRISIPEINFKKFKEVILYILNRVGAKPNVGETVIYKLLYFIDFDFYEKYEEHLLGGTYIKNHYGPTPVEFTKIIGDMIAQSEVMKVTSKYFKYPQKKYLPIRTPELEVLKAHELKHIDEVLSRLSSKTAKELSDLSHKDVPWITAKEGKPIDYESVFYRTKDYSVRNYE